MRTLESSARKQSLPLPEESVREHPRPSWPQGVSRVPVMRISDVLNTLKVEFPAVSHSKLRFLEDQGFITPVRTNAGYRQYSAHDLERLRYVLTEQRDRYLPLKVIKEKLHTLDVGLVVGDSPTGPRVVSSDGLTGAQAVLARLQDLSDETGASAEFVAELYKADVLREHHSARTDADLAVSAQHDAEIVRLALALAPFGIDWRHLRSLRASADRSINLLEQSLSHLDVKKTSSAQGQANALREELGEILGQLHIVWLRAGISENGV